MTYALAAVAGALVGGVLGALGAGGSLLTVPALVVLLGLNATEATGTSLVVVAAMAVAGLIVHRRAGRCSCREGAIFAAAGTLTALGAGWLAGRIPERWLAVAFVVVLLGTAVWFAGRGRDADADAGEEAAEEHTHGGDIDLPRVIASGAGIGVLTGILGVGGGFLVVPALVGALGLPIGVAIGTSQLVILINALAGLAGRALGSTTIVWGIGAAFAAGGVVGSAFGSKVTDRFAPRTLHLAFAAIALVAGVVMLLRTFG